jgi:hypothetical protein
VPEVEVIDGTPAPLPATAPADPGDIGAVGPPGDPPLPPPPPDAPRASVRTGPWRGRGWIGFGLGATLSPLEQRRDRVLSGGAWLEGGLRLHRHVGLATRLGTYVGSARREDGYDDDGDRVVVTAVGRVTTWDVARLRLFFPVRRRLEPWVDVGGGLAVEHPPFATSRTLWGTSAQAIGLDMAVAPRLSVSLFVENRMLLRPGRLREALSVWLALMIRF